LTSNQISAINTFQTLRSALSEADG